MKSELKNEELVKRFLLGQLSESERAEVEDRFLSDDPLFQEMLTGEDDLIDAYVRGELPAPERALFERSCLSTQKGRQRVEFARNLSNSISGRTETVETARAQPATIRPRRRSLFGSLTGNRPALSFALAAALLLVVVVGLWLLLEKRRTRPLSQRVEAGRKAAPVEQPRESPPPVTAAEQGQPQEVKETPKPAPSQEQPKRAVVATFTLLPGATRGGGDANSILLPGGTTTARLRLVLEGETYKEYRAALSTAEGRRVWGSVITKGISNRSANLTLSLPADLLVTGDYILELSGANQNGDWEGVADYAFRVVRR